MASRMTTASRLQQRYDRRLRDLVHATGHVTIASSSLDSPGLAVQGPRQSSSAST